MGISENQTLPNVRGGRRVTVAGLVLVRQRPGTASGVIFTTLEDETGIANVVVWPRTFEQFRPVVLGGRFISVTGKVQSESGVIHVIADRINDLTPMLATLTAAGTELETLLEHDRIEKPATTFSDHALARADEVRRPGHDVREHPKPRGLAFRHPRHEPIGNEIAAVVEETKSVMPKGRNFH